MIEQIFNLSTDNKKVIEKVIFDENIHYLHLILQKNDALPEHFSNSNVYMTILKGTLSISLGEQPYHEYSASKLLKIPFNTKMNVKNLHEENLELIIVKAPAPKQ